MSQGRCPFPISRTNYWKICLERQGNETPNSTGRSIQCKIILHSSLKHHGCGTPDGTRNSRVRTWTNYMRWQIRRRQLQLRRNWSGMRWERRWNVAGKDIIIAWNVSGISSHSGYGLWRWKRKIRNHSERILHHIRYRAILDIGKATSYSAIACWG